MTTYILARLRRYAGSPEPFCSQITALFPWQGQLLFKVPPLCSNKKIGSVTLIQTQSLEDYGSLRQNSAFLHRILFSELGMGRVFKNLPFKIANPGRFTFCLTFLINPSIMPLGVLLLKVLYKLRLFFF